MSYLIDSDWTASGLKGRSDARAIFAELLPLGVAISVITHMEVREGILGGSRPEEAASAFARLLVGVTVLPFTQATAEHAARIRLDLRRQKRQVRERALDLLIAATAIEHGLFLVTRNTADFDDIPNLRLYNPA